MRRFPSNEIECFDCNTGPSADSCAKCDRVSRDFTTERTTPTFAELGGNSPHDEEGGESGSLDACPAKEVLIALWRFVLVPLLSPGRTLREMSCFGLGL